jgi:hypothetical protein
VTPARKLQLLAIATVAIGCMLVEPAAARLCFWDGSSPICRGQCPRGFKVVAYKRCLSGFKVKCCEPLGYKVWKD